MPDKVVDASVVAAIAFQEPMANAAERMLEEGQLAAPDFLAYELTSVALKKIQQNPAGAETIEEALRDAFKLEIQSIDVDHLTVLRLALETGLTTYDASYLYLARVLGASLVTFDRRLQETMARFNR